MKKMSKKDDEDDPIELSGKNDNLLRHSLFRGDIEFFMKIYNNGLMSNYLKRLPLQSELYIQGPVGTGNTSTISLL